jgi:glycerol-3-phosphate dehydrogenase (NAD(P)+)
MKLSVIGAGSWGTALAAHFSRSGHDTVIWAFESEIVQGINSQHHNPLFMKEYTLPDSLSATADLKEALHHAEILITAVPTQFTRSVFEPYSDELQPVTPIVSASKGIENSTLQCPSVILADVFKTHNRANIGVMVGPSFANEVLQNQPTTVVLAIPDTKIAQQLQHEFSGETFRVYRSTDVVGVEHCAALKNVIALASGVISGLGLGYNTRAALITRGLSEITRLVTAMGGEKTTVAGIAGVGDMVLTCTSATSRNFTVGCRLGKGETLNQIINSMNMVAEGVKTTASALELSKKLKVEMPITEAMYNVINNDLDPHTAVYQLMTRSLKHEWED